MNFFPLKEEVFELFVFSLLPKCNKINLFSTELILCSLILEEIDLFSNSKLRTLFEIIILLVFTIFHLGFKFLCEL